KEQCMKKTTKFALALLTAISVVGLATAAESTLDQIKSSKTIRLGYRDGSIPFSFVGDDKQPRGYSVDLCKMVADDIAKQLKLEKLDVQWVPVTAQSRFDALKSKKIDLECGNSTQTISRRADFDFSVMTYVDGASLLFRKGEVPTSADHMAGQRIVVVSGTTTEKALDAMGTSGKLGAALVRVPDHGAALKALADKRATAYAADRTVLLTSALTSGLDMEFELSAAQFTYEPYGLMMRIDPAFRLAVDRSLARLYRTGEISPVFQRWFGALGKPGEAIKVMFLLNGLPE
ncbi:MAG: amino acid ABC transporter substrate-binding protein, partial [Azonexus sp.]